VIGQQLQGNYRQDGGEQFLHEGDRQQGIEGEGGFLIVEGGDAD
jgi:hypothetical protein